MMEWYEAYADYTDGMRRTEEFVAASVRGALGTTVITRDGREIDMAPPWPRKPLVAYREACGVDVLEYPRQPGRREGAACRPASSAALPRQPRATSTGPSSSTVPLSHFVEPSIVQPVLPDDYPTELSPLARPFANDPSLVERYEAFCCGMEFANGYSELNDPELQLERFREQVAMRERRRRGRTAARRETTSRPLRYGLPPHRRPGPAASTALAMLVCNRPARSAT